MTHPLTPEGVNELDLAYAREYRTPVDRMKQLIEACERFDTSHKTLALLSQHVTVKTIVKAVVQADMAVSQQQEYFRS